MTLITLQRHDPDPVRRSPPAASDFTPRCRRTVAVLEQASTLLLGGVAFLAIVGGLVALRAAIWMPDLWR